MPTNTSVIGGPSHTKFIPPASFDDWRLQVRREGAVPIIGVAGSRGKSTVIRLIDAIFKAAGLRTATWTDMGIEIRGRHQRGELGPWSRVMEQLGESRIDVAIQELDWSTVRAVGLPKKIYPILAITNVCVNSDECMIHEEARRAMIALPSVLQAVHPEGTLVLNGEDYAISGDEVHASAPTVLAARSHENPLIRSQLHHDGTAVWIDHNEIVIGTLEQKTQLCRANALPITLDGEASFQLMNVMVAASAAFAAGISADVIREALSGFSPDPLTLPGSFNLIDVGGIQVIVDRPDPSWFLRPVLRVVRDIPRTRLITVAGLFDEAPNKDLQEIGRLLGRSSSALILHSQETNFARAERLRRGIAMNDVPPVVVHTTTERRAVNRALKMARPGDALLILADQAPTVIRSILRAAAAPETERDEELLDSA